MAKWLLEDLGEARDALLSQLGTNLSDFVLDELPENWKTVLFVIEITLLRVFPVLLDIT